MQPTVYLFFVSFLNIPTFSMDSMSELYASFFAETQVVSSTANNFVIRFASTKGTKDYIELVNLLLQDERVVDGLSEKEIKKCKIINI